MNEATWSVRGAIPGMCSLAHANPATAFMGRVIDAAGRTVNAAAICIIAILCVAGQSPTLATSSRPVIGQDDAPLKPGVYWILSSKWRWNASGIGGLAGWRVEREDWNDTITIREATGSHLLLELKRAGQGALEASGGFIISGQASDSWKIDGDYSLGVNATTFRDSDGRPVRWIIDLGGLDASGSVPQMWTDKDYRYVEVEFRVTGSERLSVGSAQADAWTVSHRDLTTGYWSREGKHSIGFKEETLHFDKKFGLLLRDEYVGRYALNLDGVGWNETETFTAKAVDSNADFSEGNGAANPTALIVTSLGFSAAGVVFVVLIVRSRRKGQSARSVSSDQLCKRVSLPDASPGGELIRGSVNTRLGTVC